MTTYRVMVVVVVWMQLQQLLLPMIAIFKKLNDYALFLANVTELTDRTCTCSSRADESGGNVIMTALWLKKPFEIFGLKSLWQPKPRHVRTCSMT